MEACWIGQFVSSLGVRYLRSPLGIEYDYDVSVSSSWSCKHKELWQNFNVLKKISTRNFTVCMFNRIIDHPDDVHSNRRQLVQKWNQLLGNRISLLNHGSNRGACDRGTLPFFIYVILVGRLIFSNIWREWMVGEGRFCIVLRQLVLLTDWSPTLN